MSSFLQEAQAEQMRLEAQFKNDISVAEAKRDFELKKATYDQEINAKKATADMAYKLQVMKHEYPQQTMS